MPRTSNARVTVSLPYFKQKQQLRRVVESILGQTHTDLRLVAVNDGDDEPPWDLLADIRDPRLIRFDLQSNHGRYFADAVVLNATADPYFLVQDANDWSEPERIAILLEIMREDHADAAISAEYHYGVLDENVIWKTKKEYATISKSLTYTFENRASFRGLFKTKALREIGGTYAGFRAGYGALLMHFLLMIGRISYIDDPLYHRVIQCDALKYCSGTRMSSADRKKVALQLEQLYNEAFEPYIDYLSGQIEARTLARRIRYISKRCVSQQDQHDLVEEASRLQAILDSCASEPVSYSIIQNDHNNSTAEVVSAKELTVVVTDSKTKAQRRTGRPFVSIIIPTYDDDLRLEWLLEGLCRQTVKEFEVIVVNDAGPNSTEMLVNSFAERLDISYYYFGRPKLEQRTGATRNYGARYSVGELLVFLDTDMVPDPDLVEAYTAHYLPNVALFGHRRFYPLELVRPFVPPLDYEELYAHSSSDWRFTPEVRRQLRQWHLHFFGCNYSIPARIFCELGGHDERLEGWSSEDLDIGYRIAASGYAIYPLWGIGMGTHLDHPPRPRSSVPQPWQCNPNEPLCRNNGPLNRLYD